VNPLNINQLQSIEQPWRYHYLNDLEICAACPTNYFSPLEEAANPDLEHRPLREAFLLSRSAVLF
jgi:hypothetical protein